MPLEQLLGALLEALAGRPSVDRDLLSVAEVAAALRCSEDTVRRIPRAVLPVYRVGKANLYFREDVLAFVRGQGAAPAEKAKKRCVRAVGLKPMERKGNVDDLISEVLGFGTADASKPAERRAG